MNVVQPTDNKVKIFFLKNYDFLKIRFESVIIYFLLFIIIYFNECIFGRLLFK